MPTPHPVDVVDLSDDHARLSADRLPRSPNRLGCRVCGRPSEEHGITRTLHRFVRPDLPAGYRYLDSVHVGEVLTLRREPAERLTVQVTQLERALLPNDDGLLWVGTARRDCFLLHPATIVAAAEAA